TREHDRLRFTPIHHSRPQRPIINRMCLELRPDEVAEKRSYKQSNRCVFPSANSDIPGPMSVSTRESTPPLRAGERWRQQVLPLLWRVHGTVQNLRKVLAH
ncbi:hypothetical protein OV208_15160, partial [Corallococcus sp. bb12-1]|uniref:hypothetical protein n=1 Tax=Corallococcus sp. bb12-1 TaxID=2996784 RepID=UPI0022720740